MKPARTPTCCSTTRKPWMTPTAPKPAMTTCTIANKLDDDLQELLATNISLLTDSEEILLRNARELIAEAADHINKIIDPDA